MDLLIILKWNTNYVGITDQAPSIIVTIVNFFLNSGQIKGQEFFTANQFVSQILLCKSVSRNQSLNLLLTKLCQYSDRNYDHPVDVTGKPLSHLARRKEQKKIAGKAWR